MDMKEIDLDKKQTDLLSKYIWMSPNANVRLVVGRLNDEIDKRKRITKELEVLRDYLEKSTKEEK